MNRKGFLRSIFVVAVAPKIMRELQAKSIAVPLDTTPINQDFFNAAFNESNYKTYKSGFIDNATFSIWLTEFNNQEF